MHFFYLLSCYTSVLFEIHSLTANLRNYVRPYLKEHSEKLRTKYNNINLFGRKKLKIQIKDNARKIKFKLQIISSCNFSLCFAPYFNAAW
jgi:hypothetical protein